MGSELQQEPPQPTPSTMSFLANAVRIERLSDDEDVDITDDLSEDEGADNKAEGYGPQQQTETGTQPESPSEEQTEPGLTWTESQDQSSPSLQTHHSSSSLVCTEEAAKTEKDEKILEHQRTDAEDDGSSQDDVSAQTDPLGGADCDTTGEPRLHGSYFIFIQSMY